MSSSESHDGRTETGGPRLDALCQRLLGDDPSGDESVHDDATLRGELIEAFLDHRLTGTSERTVATLIADDQRWKDDHLERLRKRATGQP